MENASLQSTSRKDPFTKIIIALSIVIPVCIAVLFSVKIDGYNFSFLPPIYAGINGLTAILLIAAFISIKNGRQRSHELLMKTCMVLSALFLVMYVLYHMTTESTSFGGIGYLRNIYFFVLITHILLSIVVIPLVLFTYLRAWRKDFKGHRKLARIAFPIWLYVAVTGAIVYLMISPYYK
jgi:putative membrane protein